MARVRYHAWRTAIPRVAWTNGTIAVPRSGVAALYGTDLLFVLRELIHALVVDLIRQRGLRKGGDTVTGSRLGSDLGLAY